MKPLEILEKALKDKDSLVKDYARGLYEFIKASDCYKKINEYADMEDTGAEYEQLYKKVIDFLDKISRTAWYRKDCNS